jgi:hypothetical protein
MQTHARVLPAARQELLDTSEPFVALFAAGDCPGDQRATFQQLRGEN